MLRFVSIILFFLFISFSKDCKSNVYFEVKSITHDIIEIECQQKKGVFILSVLVKFNNESINIERYKGFTINELKDIISINLINNKLPNNYKIVINYTKDFKQNTCTINIDKNLSLKEINEKYNNSISFKQIIRNYKNLITYQSNPDLDFMSFMNGLVGIYIIVDENMKKDLMSTNSLNKFLILGLLDYYKTLGFTDVKWGLITDFIPCEYYSSCAIGLVYPSWKTNSQSYTDFQLDYVTCNLDVFTLQKSKNIMYSDISTGVMFHNVFMEMFGYKRNYDIKNMLLKNTYFYPSELFTSEEKIKKYLDTNNNYIEGIYENISVKDGSKYKVAVIKKKNNFEIIYIDGAHCKFDWWPGDLKGYVYKTASENLMKCEWVMADKKNLNKDCYASFDSKSMKLTINGFEEFYLKLYPISNNNKKTSSKSTSSSILQSTGSGFAISSDGFIVTNNHVIDGATEIKIRGINGDMKKSMKAVVISKDEKNDLAILKIDDPKFTNLGNVPINIVQKPIEVGSSVFVLGYPMIDAMGDEIKLTDGKISSRTGFQGDVSTYQISAPIQPGNSGGPLFDEDGNLIGITSSGIRAADNVGYAIKTSYLMNMFDAMQDYPNLTKTNTILKKKLPEKIKILKNYIYIIENYQ